MTYSSFKEIADLWPDRRAWARAIGAPYPTAVGMILRGNVHAAYFVSIVRAARKIGHADITYELLCTLAARKKHGLCRARARPAPRRASGSGAK